MVVAKSGRPIQIGRRLEVNERVAHAVGESGWLRLVRSSQRFR